MLSLIGDTAREARCAKISGLGLVRVVGFGELLRGGLLSAATQATMAFKDGRFVEIYGGGVGTWECGCGCGMGRGMGI